jgi:hypothetical protein
MHFCLMRRFLPVSMCVTQILVKGRGRSYSSFPSTPGRIRPPPLFLSQPWADLSTDLWAIQPTGREVTDFKKPVSVRVKSEKH